VNLCPNFKPGTGILRIKKLHTIYLFIGRASTIKAFFLMTKGFSLKLDHTVEKVVFFYSRLLRAGSVLRIEPSPLSKMHNILTILYRIGNCFACRANRCVCLRLFMFV
jgi:hypothetical protein